MSSGKKLTTSLATAICVMIALRKDAALIPGNFPIMFFTLDVVVSPADIDLNSSKNYGRNKNIADRR
jgi:hypothetical protein